MLQLYSGAGGALATTPAAATAQSAQLAAAFSLPTTSASTPSASAASYAFLNGQNSQVSFRMSSVPNQLFLCFTRQNAPCLLLCHCFIILSL